MTRSPCPDQQTWQQLASGRLPADRVAGVEQHLETCEDCAASLAAAMTAEPLAAAIRQVEWSTPPTDSEDEATARRVAAAVETQLNRSFKTFISPPSVLSAAGQVWMDMPIEPGDLGRIGQFRVVRKIGYGGMGAVYEAVDQRLKRTVALKVMLPQMADDLTARERFLREARSAAAVHHRNVVTIHEVGQCENVPYLVMELLSGETLEDRLQREGSLSPQTAAEIAAQIAEGLAAAHGKGLLHRDVKPANVWLESNHIRSTDSAPIVKLLDFGLAKSLSGSDDLTQSGMVVGTVDYLSPEQARGEKLDERSDLFSLGCILYRMLSGRSPFPGSDVLSKLNALANTAPVAIDTLVADLPPALAQLTLELISNPVELRPAAASVVAERLRRPQALPRSGEPVQTAISQDAHVRHGWRTAKERIVAGLLMGGILLGAIIITIQHRDGTKSQITIESRPDSKPNDAIPATNPVPVAGNQVVGAGEAGPQVQSLDHFDLALIPAAERFDWQPKELVAVIGTHHLHHWSSVKQIRFHPSGHFFVTVPERHPSGVWLTKSLEDSENSLPDGGGSSGGFSFSQDGNWMFSANQVYAVDMTISDEPKIRLSKQLSAVENRFGNGDVIIHENRWLLVSSPETGMLSLWDLKSEPTRVAMTVKITDPHIYPRLTLSKDGHRLIATDQNQNVIQVWDVKWGNSGDPTFTKREQSIPGNIAALSPDGSTLVACEIGVNKLEVWDITENSMTVKQEIKSGAVLTQFSPEGNRLFIGVGHQIDIYDRVEGAWTLSSTLTDAMDIPTSLAISPDQGTLVAGCLRGGIHVWDVSINPPRSKTVNLPGSNVVRLAAAPDGRSVMVVGSDNQVASWNLSQPVPSRGDWATFGEWISYSADSRLACVQGQVWNMNTQPPTRISDGVGVSPRFGPKGYDLFALDHTGNTMFHHHGELTQRGRYVLSNETTTWTSPEAMTSNDAIETLNFDARRFATRQTDHTVCVWNLDDTTQPSHKLHHDLQNVSRITLSPDGKLLLILSQPGSIVWDMEESPPREYKLQLEGAAQNAFFTQDGKRLLVAEGNGVGIYDWAHNREVRRLYYPGPVRQIIPHPDQRHLFTVNNNGTIYVLRLPELAPSSP